MKTLVCILSMLLGCSLAAETIPFDPSRGLVEVNVTLNGIVKGKFGIDTGADRLYIDRTFAKDNGLELLNGPGQRDIVGVEGSSKAGFVSLRSLTLGSDQTLYNLSATAVDMNALTNDTTGGMPDGLIGADILNRFFVCVDYPNRTLDLYSFEPKFLNGKQYDEIEFSQYQHLILVDATIGDTTVPMILDYCASYTTIDLRLAESLGLGDRDGARVSVPSIALSGNVESENVRAVVSDLSTFHRRIPRADFSGIIGASFLYRFKMTVDYKRKLVYVER
ncbi:MAG TPA: aspartyl protease family protein [candidate division Zixibacteria bacterium]|nr:aspartyl protease family protein [candidate division Zixibacteria bacterium]